MQKVYTKYAGFMRSLISEILWSIAIFDVNIENINNGLSNQSEDVIKKGGFQLHCATSKSQFIWFDSQIFGTSWTCCQCFTIKKHKYVTGHEQFKYKRWAEERLYAKCCVLLFSVVNNYHNNADTGQNLFKKKPGQSYGITSGKTRRLKRKTKKSLTLAEVLKEVEMLFHAIKNVILIALANPCTSAIEKYFRMLRQVKMWPT